MTESKRPALLVGSLNLATREDVFEAVGSALSDRLRSVPDGETGDRGSWIDLEANRIAALPELEVVKRISLESPVAGELHRALLAPREGVDLGALSFGPFGYVEDAVASYDAFERSRASGRFSAETRFQVSIPTPMMFAMLFPGHRREALPGLERALAEEVARLVEAVPAGDLAIQWDVAGETQFQEQVRLGVELWAARERWPLEEATESIARVSAEIPEATLLGIHLCFGDAEGKHPFQPRDLATCVALANGIAGSTDRRLDWVHMPVPVERDDAAYFAPLADLRLAPETELYLGLLHREDGIEGAGRRIKAAASYREEFGVATECGMGREPREAVAALVDLHAEAARL